MRNVVFLVKNGIGFGHIRRALILAEALQKHTDLRPIVVSQAHSLDLYHTASVRVVNFPLLHRVPSAVTEDCYLELLDELMAKLDPAAVVEDTYPDARYGALQALAHVPRILVMRRLDGLSFDQLRERNAFARYTEILIAQRPEEFATEGHSGDSVASIQSSRRVRFVGNIHHVPSNQAVDAAKRRFAPDGQPLIVVNGGAGGDQMPDGYGDRLFNACAEVARRLAAERSPARFVLVTGPYYAGHPLNETTNVIVRRFESQLSALLAAADVAVIKPGNNALSEALVGSSRLVLVPDVSFMEGLDGHSARIVGQYGGVIAKPDADTLDEAIRQALTQPPRHHRTTPDNTSVNAVVAAIRALAEPTEPTISPKQLAVLIRDSTSIRMAYSAETNPGDWSQLDVLSNLRPEEQATRAVVIDDDPPDHLSPEIVTAAGTRLLINFGSQLRPAVKRWLRMAPSVPSLLTVKTTVITPRTSKITDAARRVSWLLDRQSTAAVVLDLRHLQDADCFTSDLLRWLSTQPVELTSCDTLASAEADRLLGFNT